MDAFTGIYDTWQASRRRVASARVLLGRKRVFVKL